MSDMEGKTIDKKILASRLKELREKNNLKQRDMYEAMQCSQSAYSSYENPDSVKFPSAENLYNLSQRFNVSIDWLLGNEISQEKSIEFTVADVIRCLFWIDEKIGIEVKHHEYEIPFEVGKLPKESVNTYELNFPDHCVVGDELNEFLKEWKETKEFCEGKTIGQTMYNLWKKDTLKRASLTNLFGGFSLFARDFTDAPDVSEQ